MDKHTQEVLAYSLEVLQGQTEHSFSRAFPASNSSRSIEVPWLAKKLAALKAKRQLDVGFSLSSLDTLGMLLRNRRENQVELEAVDIIEPSRVKSRYPAEWVADILSVPVAVGDIREIDLSPNSYDLVTLISTIEHIGFDAPAGSDTGSAFDRCEREEDIRTERDPEINRKVLDKVHGALAPKGHLVLTVPMGDGGPVVLQDSLGLFCVQWEYEPVTWSEIVDHPGFEVLEQHFFRLDGDLIWRQVAAPADFAGVKAAHLSHSNGCALVLMRKGDF